MRASEPKSSSRQLRRELEAHTSAEEWIHTTEYHLPTTEQQVQRAEKRPGEEQAHWHTDMVLWFECEMPLQIHMAEHWIPS